MRLDYVKARLVATPVGGGAEVQYLGGDKRLMPLAGPHDKLHFARPPASSVEGFYDWPATQQWRRQLRVVNVALANLEESYDSLIEAPYSSQADACGAAIGLTLGFAAQNGALMYLGGAENKVGKAYQKLVRLCMSLKVVVTLIVHLSHCPTPSPQDTAQRC